jgi:hypothetical protein
MNNYSGISDEDSGISPGSSGVVTFYVIPKKTGSLTVKFKLKMTAYSENSDEQSSDDGEITLSDITALDEDSEAAQYLKGHLLYFLSYENGVYSERITDDGFSITFKDAKADEEQEVNIYWVWPYSFGQMVLKSSDENLIVLNRSGIFADSSDEKTETAKLIKNSPEIFFRSKNSDAFDSEGKFYTEI